MLIGYILILISLAELVLGSFLIFRYQRNQAQIWYGLFAMAVAVYVLGNGLGYVGALISANLSEHLAWVGGMATAIFFLPFSFTYPLPRRSARELIPLTIWPLIIFVPGLLLTDLFVRQQVIVKFGQGYMTDTGSYFWFMIAIFAVYWIWAIKNILLHHKNSDGLHRKNIKLIMIGLATSLLVSSFFDIYMPLTHLTRFGYIGSLFSAVWLGFTSYIILKK